MSTSSQVIWSNDLNPSKTLMEYYRKCSYFFLFLVLYHIHNLHHKWKGSNLLLSEIDFTYGLPNGLRIDKKINFRKVCKLVVDID